MRLLVISLAAFCATFTGGLFALRLQHKLHLVLGFSAGAVIAVAFFDLLPEAINLAAPLQSVASVPVWSALGFLTYLVLDRIQLPGSPEPDAHKLAIRQALRRGAMGAGSLSAHSFLDGIAIGVAFQASSSVGMIVTVAVLAHDFSDGINTMAVVLKNDGSRQRALRWLLADAVAPGLGIASTLLFRLSPGELGIVLALFAGFFLYIGASDLIPESYHVHPQFMTTLLTLLSAALLYLAVVLVNH
ncbi:MAG: ZIP family metal transporter [Steroidobacteraceae bacterium]|jgi:ZIP family zinc transporter